jgi:hypothetical protein
MRIQLIAAGLGLGLVACSGGAPGLVNTCNHEGELATVGEHCPATYDGTEANVPMCPTAFVGFPVYDRVVWQCQDLSVLQFWSGFGALVCYYDTVSRALVGAEIHGDTSCDGTLRGIEAGRINSMCRENAPLFSGKCAAP